MHRCAIYLMCLGLLLASGCAAKRPAPAAMDGTRSITLQVTPMEVEVVE